MKRRIYIETTIPSFYHTLRTDVESVARMNWTRQWWETYASECDLATSLAVIEELSQSTSAKRQDRLDLLAEMSLLAITDEIDAIARTYIDRLVMPRDPSGDALHLAVAAFHGVDILLTWNCKHLANVGKIGHIRKVNQELGLPTPELATPLNFLGGND